MGDAPAAGPALRLHLAFEGSRIRTEKDVEGLDLELRMGLGRRLPPGSADFSPGRAQLNFATTDPQGLFTEILRSLTPDLRALLKHAFFLDGGDPEATTVLWRDGGPAFRSV